MSPKILIDKQDVIPEEAWRSLAACTTPVKCERGTPFSESELIEELQGFSGLIRLGANIPDLTRRVFAEVPSLKIVGMCADRFGTGVDMEAAEDFGVKIVDTDNISSSQPVAEWDLAMILICLRNAGAVYRQMIEGVETWGNAGNEEFVSGELTERKVGLIGCGHVGQRLIQLLQPFRVDLLVYDPYVSEELALELDIVLAGLDEVLRHAEILVVQVPHTPRTEKMIGERELDLLGKGRIIVNCCRGKVVDQAALIRKLQAGELIAGLDVFDPEPMEKASPLRTFPNAFITPHIAWYAPHALHRNLTDMALEFERFFRGEPLQYELTRRLVDIRKGKL